MEADAGVRARSDSPWSPGVLAPDSSTHSRLQATIGDHTGSQLSAFHSSGVTATVMETLRISAGSPSLRVTWLKEVKERTLNLDPLGDQQGSADSGSVTKSMSRSTAPTSAGSRSA